MSGKIARATLPADSLLEIYRAAGSYVDCYGAEVARAISLSELVEAFYTSPAFRPERWLLGALLGMRADNTDVARLAADEVESFSAWTVEARRDDQILLCDYQGRTRSWLMARGTLVYFGSAVVKPGDLAFRMLLGFHRFYSRLLLRAAVAKL